MTRSFFMFGVMVLFAAGVLFYLGRSTQGPGKTAQALGQYREAPSSNAPDLEARIAVLENRLKASEGVKSEMPVPSSTPPSEAPQVPIHPEDPEEILERHAQASARVDAESNALFEKQSRDNIWANTAEESIRSTVKQVAGEGGSYSFKSLRCLTSICKAEISFPNLTGRQGALGALFAYLPSMGMAAGRGGQPVRQADGTYSVEYTFFRKGYPVPGTDGPPP